MQLPYRKPGKYAQVQTDPLITWEKFEMLQKKRADLLAKRPQLADEVHRLAQNGDFSENAEYQAAKGKLRGLNDTLTKLDYEIDHAILITKNISSEVSVGDVVTVRDTASGETREYHILGSAETNPGRGVISHGSPIGQALLGKEVGDMVTITLPAKQIEYEIISIQ